MDCQMPVLDGYSAARQIRLWESGRSRVPIIALTAHALPDEKDKVLAAGMDDYLSKPLRPQSLERLLERCVRGQRSTLAPSGVSPPPPDETPELDPEVPRSQKLIGLFLDRMPVQLDSLDAALDAADLEALKRAAHKMKGGCLSLGALRMARVAASIEDQALAGDLLALRMQTAVARRQYQAAAASLSGDRPRSSPTRRSAPVA